MDSASLLSGSYHASCASDNQELTYMKRIRTLCCLRLSIALISLAIALAVIGCEAEPLRHYKRTSEYARIWLYLWPLNLDLRPTIALLSCGCVVALLDLGYAIVALMPSPHTHVSRLNILATATALSSFITSIVGFLFMIYLPSSTYPPGFTYNETLQSWTCKWKTAPHHNPGNSQNPPIQEPSHFTRDCIKARAGIALMGILIGLGVVMGVTAGVGFWLERRVKRQRKYGRFGLEEMTLCAKNGSV